MVHDLVTHISAKFDSFVLSGEIIGVKDGAPLVRVPPQGDFSGIDSVKAYGNYQVGDDLMVSVRYLPYGEGYYFVDPPTLASNLWVALVLPLLVFGYLWFREAGPYSKLAARSVHANGEVSSTRVGWRDAGPALWRGGLALMALVSGMLLLVLPILIGGVENFIAEESSRWSITLSCGAVFTGSALLFPAAEKYSDLPRVRRGRRLRLFVIPAWVDVFVVGIPIACILGLGLFETFRGDVEFENPRSSPGWVVDLECRENPRSGCTEYLLLSYEADGMPYYTWVRAGENEVGLGAGLRSNGSQEGPGRLEYRQSDNLHSCSVFLVLGKISGKHAK